MSNIFSFVAENWALIVAWYFVIGFVSEVFFWVKYLFKKRDVLKELKILLLAEIKKARDRGPEFNELYINEDLKWLLRKTPQFKDCASGFYCEDRILESLEWLDKNPPNFSLSRASGQTVLWPIFLIVDGLDVVDRSVRAIWGFANNGIRFVTLKLWTQLVK